MPSSRPSCVAWTVGVYPVVGKRSCSLVNGRRAAKRTYGLGESTNRTLSSSYSTSTRPPQASHRGWKPTGYCFPQARQIWRTLTSGLSDHFFPCNFATAVEEKITNCSRDAEAEQHPLRTAAVRDVHILPALCPTGNGRVSRSHRTQRGNVI